MDIVLDAEHGPTVLELNARPGLAIQLANAAGLQSRLGVIDRLNSRSAPPQIRVQQAREWFGRVPQEPGSHEAA